MRTGLPGQFDDRHDKPAWVLGVENERKMRSTEWEMTQ